jgi:hypothetical protein
MTTAKTKKADADINGLDAMNEAMSQAQAWNEDAVGKLRELAGKINDDIKTTGTIAIEGQARHSSRLFQLVGDLFNARTAATMNVLQSADLNQAIAVEQNYARDLADTLKTGVTELTEISTNAYREASQTFTARAQEAVDTIARTGAKAG